MYRLLEFLRSIYTLLLFIILETGAIYLYVNSNSYTQARLISYTASLSSAVGSVTGSVEDYFTLRKENERLISRIAELERELSHISFEGDDLLLSSGCDYRAARVVSNTINRAQNYLIIDCGEEDGVCEGMGVISLDRDIVGVVMATSPRHSVVMSVLNTAFRTSGQIEGQEEMYAGSIYWGGENRYQVRMRDLSKYASVKSGAMVTTTSFSQIFPEGVRVGRVVDFEFDPEHSSYIVDIELSKDPSSLRRVLVVDNRPHFELESLPDGFNESQIIK